MISGLAPLTIHFTDTTPAVNETLSRLWDFGDGSTSIEENPQHTFSTEGLYQVSLTVSNGISSSTYTDEVLVIPANQSSYWPLDEESGTRIDDVAGLNLTDNNGVLHAPGMFGRAAKFVSASSQYLSRGASGTELYPQGSYTISMWIYPTGTTAGEIYTMIGKTRNSATDRPYSVAYYYSYLSARRQVNIRWTGSDGSLAIGACPNEAVPANEWTHIAFGFDTSIKKGRFWINGVDQAASFSGVLTANPVTTGTCPFVIGASTEGGAPDKFFQGRIQQTRIFDRVLSDAEVGILAMEIPEAQQTSEERAAQIMLDISNDGGKTWIAQPWRSIGGAGQWAKRVRWNRLGAARRRVFQVSVTDPVPWKLTGAYLDDPNGGSGGR